jgi:hypothetical protein
MRFLIGLFLALAVFVALGVLLPASLTTAVAVPLLGQIGAVSFRLLAAAGTFWFCGR